MSNQASNGRTTGMVLAQHLAKKDPQRNQRRIDPVEPDNIQCFQCLRNSTFRKYISERQFAVLEELPSQKTHLFAKSSVDRKRHREASCLGWVCDNAIYAREAFFIYINSGQHLTQELRTIPFSDNLPRGLRRSWQA